MSELDFSATRNQLVSLYEQGAYVEALDLLEQEAARFPQQGVMYHWKMCLSARAGEPAKALLAFREALANGYWYPARLLREDEDLRSLQGLPEYEDLVAASIERFNRAESSSKPELLIIRPEDGSVSPTPLLIGLHGNSQNSRLAANDWLDLRKWGWTLAFPQSSQLLTTDAYIWDDFEHGADEVENLCGELIDNQSVDPQRVVLGGFSAGGGLAIQLAVSGKIRTRGFLVIGPYLRDLQALTPFLETARTNGIRGYMIMGLKEPSEGQELMRRTAAFLQEHGIPCVMEQHPELAHAFPPDFGSSLQKAVSFLFSE